MIHNSIFHLFVIRKSFESFLAGMMQRKDLYTIRKSSSIIPKLFTGIVHSKSLPDIFIDYMIWPILTVLFYLNAEISLVATQKKIS